MDAEELAALTGTAFPGGEFVIAAHEDWLLRDVIGAPGGDGRRAHPLWGFAAPQRSMGITIDEIFELCGSHASEGPLLGDTVIEYEDDLLIGRRYTVAAEIIATVRKHGRTAGTFDIVHFTATTCADDARTVGHLTNSFIFPRPSIDAPR